jgi:3-carboxy-cis,cis-muconate cycloisomerase
MRANLEATRGAMVSEGVMLALARHTGKQTAHDLVYRTAMDAAEAGQPLKAALLGNAAIMEHLSAAELDALFDEARHVGMCPQFVDRVVDASNTLRQADIAFLGEAVGGRRQNGTGH